MKLGFLLLLPLLAGPPASGPAAVRVTFKSLTKSAYLQAKKGCVTAKPRVTFPLKKEQGLIVIPTAKGQKTYQDKSLGTDNDDQAQFEYAGFTPQFGYHIVIAQLWERTQTFLVDESGKQLEFYDNPQYSPDMKSFVVVSSGLEYAVYPNVTRLFRFKNRAWQEIWSITPKAWEPSQICWTSPTTLLLSRKMWTGKSPGNTFTHAEMVIN
ncbi:hypothetical protein [Hymenobacter coccineus]|uniref:Uncharacterized protein n=1 Tax=Hymenobacter coccineus TaxID=1908235 RepID=A0A1G1T9G8_9BACT|nr:hypothetical protein [Hymenobacter coccineus]OGX87512.1 hypothetical protein BEN49_10620 [Hymenobacter coccineus]